MGKVPTTPTSASIVAAFQTQEALKLFPEAEKLSSSTMSAVPCASVAESTTTCVPPMTCRSFGPARTPLTHSRRAARPSSGMLNASMRPSSANSSLQLWTSASSIRWA